MDGYGDWQEIFINQYASYQSTNQITALTTYETTLLRNVPTRISERTAKNKTLLTVAGDGRRGFVIRVLCK